MHDHQRKVKQFIGQYRLECSIEARLFDVLSELGELAKEVLKSSDYGVDQCIPSKEFAEELGDVYFSLLALANAAQVDLEELLQAALEKYAVRHRSSGSVGSKS